MATIVTRAGKGSPLTNAEIDTNFNNLNTAKLEKDNAQYLDFDTAAGYTVTAGQMAWNDDEGTLNIGMKGGNVTLQTGQEELVYVLNNTGATLLNMQVVRVTGAQGNRITVAKAQANSESSSATSLAVMTEDVLNGATGFATRGGLVRNIDTSAFTEGSALYLSADTLGGYAAVRPTAPNHTVLVGWVVRSHATAGSIFVNIQNGYELDELHDVLITSKANGDSLWYNSTSGVWENLTPANAKIKLSLNNVENKSSATIRSEITSSNVTTALGFTPENAANKGSANGYAPLDSTSKVPSAYLPSFVDDVLEYANIAAFPASGETGKIYVALDTNKTYRWSGTVYIYITSGAVDSVAGKTGVVTLVKGDVGLGNVENTALSTWSGSSNITTVGTIVSGIWTGTTIAVANGGTGATTAAAARTNLGLVIGTNVQAWDADLDSIAALAGTSGLLKKTAANTWVLDTTAYTTNTGTVTSVAMSTPTGLTVTGSPVTGAGTLALSFTAGYSIPTTANQANWDSAYSQRLQWDGGSTNLVPATARTSLGGTTTGQNLFTVANPNAVAFLRVNADNTISALDATTFRTAIGAGTSSTTGTVTSVAGTGTVSGLSLSGTVTSSGSLTLSGTLAVLASNFASQTANTVLAAPQNAAGVPTFRNLHLSDMPSAWIKRACNAATTAALTLNTAQTTIDGVTLSATSRVLVKNQAAPAQNGIYTGLTTTTWVRAEDADLAGDIAGAFVNVDAGTVNGGKAFDTDFKSTDVLGTTAMNWYMNVDTGLALTSTSTVTDGYIRYAGTTATAGQFDGGTTTPTGTNRLNYGGYFYPTFINLAGSADTATAATHYFVETGTDGFVRPKTLANVKVEVVTSAAVIAGLGFTPYNATNPAGYVTSSSVDPAGSAIAMSIALG